MQRGGRIWASAAINLSCNALECNYCGPARKLCVEPPRVRSVSDRRRRLKECSDIEGELMRQGGRLPEQLTATERDLAGRMKLTFAVHRDSPSLVIMFCNCQIISKLPARHLCVVNYVSTSIILSML